MRRLASILAALAACATAVLPFPLRAAEAELHAATKKACLSAAETREEIKANHLHEPYEALKFAASHFKSEALSARLCRIDDDFVYEIALLHRDGKFFHAHVSAMSGKLVEIKRAPSVASKPDVLATPLH
jgi:uncharacterized membrane protein YkoI